MATGFEIALLTCIGVNSGINIAQSTSNYWNRFKRWFRLRNSRLVTISREHNPNVFYQTTKILNALSAKLRLRTLLSFGDQKVTHSFYIPDRNTEITVPTKYGNIWVKVVSLNGYRIDAYEVTCQKKQFYAIDKFLIGIFQSMEPKMENGELEEHIRSANISSENDQTYSMKLKPTCWRPWCKCDNGWFECPHK